MKANYLKLPCPSIVYTNDTQLFLSFIDRLISKLTIASHIHPRQANIQVNRAILQKLITIKYKT